MLDTNLTFFFFFLAWCVAQLFLKSYVQSLSSSFYCFPSLSPLRFLFFFLVFSLYPWRFVDTESLTLTPLSPPTHISPNTQILAVRFTLVLYMIFFFFE